MIEGDIRIVRLITLFFGALVFFTASLMAEPIRLVSNEGAVNNQALGVALREVYPPIGTVNSHHFLRDTFRHEAVVVAGT